MKVRIGTWATLRTLVIDIEKQELRLEISHCPDCEICERRIREVNANLSQGEIEWKMLPLPKENDLWLHLPFSEEKNGDVTLYLSKVLRLVVTTY